MSQVVFTRKELYDLVWSEPLLTLSTKYNISDNGLRKICVRMNISLPRTGHWQKIRAGRTVRIEALSTDYSGEGTVSLEPLTEASRPKSNVTELILLQQEIER